MATFYQKDGQRRQVFTPAQAVNLTAQGWAEVVEDDKPAKAAPKKTTRARKRTTK